LDARCKFYTDPIYYDEDAFFIEDVLENNCDFVDELNNCIHNINGNRLDITPEHKAALNALYTVTTSVGLFGLGGTVSHVSDRAMDIFNSPELTGDDYTRVDLQAWWTSPEERWTVRSWVQNATDELWYNTRSVTDNSNPGFSGGSWYPAVDYNRFSGNPASPRRYNLEVQFNL
jgi:outer membrane receptor protein involved in Fe transport